MYQLTQSSDTIYLALSSYEWHDVGAGFAAAYQLARAAPFMVNIACDLTRAEGHMRPNGFHHMSQLRRSAPLNIARYAFIGVSPGTAALGEAFAQISGWAQRVAFVASLDEAHHFFRHPDSPTF